MIGRLITRGPSGAKRPSLNESGRTQNDPNRRSRSLFARKLSTSLSSSQQQTTESHRSSSPFQFVDLEGIANDGFGYTVTITAEPTDSHAKRRTWFSRSGRRRESTSIPDTGRRSIRVPRRVASYLEDDKDIENGGAEKPGIQVIRRNSFEVRESYHEPDERGWDVRNTYTNRAQEGDIEIGFQQPASQETNWPILDEKPSGNMSLPYVPENSASTAYRPQTSPEMQYQPRRLNSRAGAGQTSSDRRRPASQGRPLSPTLSYRPIAMDSNLRSPQFYTTLTPSPLSGNANGPSTSPLQQPQNALLSPARIARAVSPVVQPLNSSQWWASNPTRPPTASSRHTGNTTQSGRTTQTRGTGRSEPGEAWPPALPADAVLLNQTWDVDRHISYHSSVAARDGSRESLVIGEDSQNPPDDDEPEMPGSPNSFMLPIDGPGISKSNE
jgi:hypothetical protein